MIRNNNLPDIHPRDDDQFKRDIAGKYVVISDKSQFSYWGKNAKFIADKKILEKLPKKQEKKEYVDNDFKELHSYIKKEFLCNDVVCDSPHNPLTDSFCRGFNKR